MKLLLTSGGITNKSIAKALFDLVGKKPSETVIAFVPTAMNANTGDKSWFADDIYRIKNLGLKFFDIVDISALPQSVWLPRLEAADVLFFSGGSTYHLMKCLKDSGLKSTLEEFLKTKVYAGISAGSMIMAPSLILSGEERRVYYRENFGYDAEDGLGYVDFFVRPHFGVMKRKENTEEYLKEMAKKVSPIYALDDQSALKVVDGKVEVISEGKYLKFI